MFNLQNFAGLGECPNRGRGVGGADAVAVIRIADRVEVGGRSPLRYDGDPTGWTRGSAFVLLDTAQRGQEVVLDMDACPRAVAWTYGLMPGVADVPRSAEPARIGRTN